VVETLLAEAETARGGDRRLDNALDRLRTGIHDLSTSETHARRLAELIAIVLQGSLLVKYGPAPVAEAFCASRLDSDWCRTYGTLPGNLPFDDIMNLARVSS
jgi:putative acyl-CoA dehydrogenase